MIKAVKYGLLSLFLLPFVGCSTLNKSQEAKTTNSPIYPPLNACTLQPLHIQTNNDLITALVQRESDWAQCAAKVDSIIKIQDTQP
ncbi:Rz1-like lysis system protein LysC [Acinetobacter nectaris]|uniref:Rz1-like lysis system protein LysC n=1 Tax=Acinetobacter nectaris TaxID=1219382 RepID=UPI003AFF9D61